MIAHASNADVLDVVALEQGEGLPAPAESCPQYLHLREDEVLTEGPFRKFTPPARIRSADDEQAMWSALRTGACTTSRATMRPSTREQKEAGTIWEVHFGLPGIDTTLALMLDAALAGRVALERVVSAYATAPAQHYGLARKGRLEPGFDADMALVDPEGGWEISDDTVVSRAGWTPYAGRRVRGRVALTLLRGLVVAQEGELVQPAPQGRFLPGAGAVADGIRGEVP